MFTISHFIFELIKKSYNHKFSNKHSNVDMNETENETFLFLHCDVRRKAKEKEEMKIVRYKEGEIVRLKERRKSEKKEGKYGKI